MRQIAPVALVADAILDCTARGDIVLDPFLGSETTLLAAERTGRCCRGIEIDPIYVCRTAPLAIIYRRGCEARGHWQELHRK
jgi:DNA modification methylase